MSMNAEEWLKAIGGLLGSGGAGWIFWSLFRRRNSADAVALKDDAGRNTMLDFLSGRVRELEQQNDVLRKEAVEAGRFSAKAELLAEHVAKLEKTMLEATAQMATLRAELEALQEEVAERDDRIRERDQEVIRLRQKLIDHGVSPD